MNRMDPMIGRHRGRSFIPFILFILSKKRGVKLSAALMFRSAAPAGRRGLDGRRRAGNEAGRQTRRKKFRQPKSARFSGATALSALDALNTDLNNLQEESLTYIGC